MSLFLFVRTPGPALDPLAQGGGSVSGGSVGRPQPTLSTPPRASITLNNTPRKNCNIMKPIMGDVIQSNPPDGEWIAWTGGTPLIDWSLLDTKSLVSTPTPTMHPNVSIKDVKGYSFCIKGMESKFGLKEDLRAFCRKVMKHFRQCGLDTITYIPDPSNPTVMESVVKSPNKFTKK
jgi:hypothetical protein